MFAFATAYTHDGEVYDHIGNLETAISYANDGYRIVVHESAGTLYTQEECQQAVDNELAIAIDCFGLEHAK